MFDSGELALVILHLTESQPRHGYDLIHEIEALTGGEYAPSPGIIYPTLTLLEELGQVETRTVEGSKRTFALTPAGHARLTTESHALAKVLTKLSALSDRQTGDQYLAQAGPVWRALQNLQTVLRQRIVLSLERQFLLEIADLIDEAARKIERL